MLSRHVLFVTALCASLSALAAPIAATAQDAPVPPKPVPSKPLAQKPLPPKPLPPKPKITAEPARSEVSKNEAQKNEVPRLDPLAASAPATPAVQAIVPVGTPDAETLAKEAAPKDSVPKDVVSKEAPPKKSRELPPLVVARVSADPAPTLSPATFLDTLKMADRYQAMADAGGWASLPPGLVVKPGARDPAIPALRKHLALVGDLAADAPASDILDAPLVAAVKSFQARHGLPETGLIGRQTVAALNVPAATRQRQLAASAARQIGSTFAFGDRYVVVNIPSATVEAVERGVVVRRYVAVVGKPDKATPRIEARITDVNLNPTWTLPVSIIKKEIIPKMRKDPGYLARERIRILGPGGVEVDPTTLDWASEKAANYTLRQDSGLDNSLGQVRIDMPNKQAVYMHDTPSKSLFAREVRFHSHGCVRVAQVKELAGWLLEGTPGPQGGAATWGPMEIESHIATNERLDIKLPKQVPVTFVYLTGYATPDGRAHFRDDIYGIDSPAVPMPEVATTGSITPRPTGRAARSEIKPGATGIVSAQAAPVKAVPARTAPVKTPSARSAAQLPPGPIPPGSIPDLASPAR